VQLLHVYAKVCLAATSCRTQLALEYRLVTSRVDQPVGLKTVALGESGMANITLIWLLSSVYTKMALQLESVWASICTVRTLRKNLLDGDKMTKVENSTW
jgi:hypothetical protein